MSPGAGVIGRIVVRAAATTVVAIAVASCDAPRRAEQTATVVEPSPARNVAPSSPIDGGVGLASTTSGLDAGAASAVSRDVPWRKAIDEVGRLLDRGASVARVAEVFGRVSRTESGALDIVPTLPWLSAAEVEADGQVVSVRLFMSPLLKRSELDAVAGPCEVGPLLGEWGDGVRLFCPPLETRRGTIEIDAATVGRSGGPSNSLVDMLMFEWRPARPRRKGR
jgi:hypothetical protein